MVDTKVQVRRAYEDPAQGDGTRVLVDPDLAARADQGQGGP